MSILEVSGLRKVYTSRLGGSRVEALRNVSFTVEQGEYVAIMGESGSGKSVLTKTLIGMTDKNGTIVGGSIDFKGTRLDQLVEKDWLAIRGKRIAMVFQDPMTALNPLKTVGEQIREMITLHSDLSKDASTEKAKKLMEQVGISADRYGRYPHEFSGGMRQRIVLAIMILPTVINISESALKAVPQNLKSASLALGASHIQTIFKVMIPAAKSGIITAIVLGTGRAIGEAMAITLVAGSSVNPPFPFNSVRFLTTAIVSEMGYAADLHRQVLFTIGLVLFVFIMLINVVLTRILKKGIDDDAK